VRWAEADRQTTLLRLLLGALHRLPIPWAMLRGSGLPRSVARLQKYKCARCTPAAPFGWLPPD
jgi:hypothetical protein